MATSRRDRIRLEKRRAERTGLFQVLYQVLADWHSRDRRRAERTGSERDWSGEGNTQHQILVDGSREEEIGGEANGEDTNGLEKRGTERQGQY